MNELPYYNAKLIKHGFAYTLLQYNMQKVISFWRNIHYTLNIRFYFCRNWHIFSLRIHTIYQSTCA